MEQESQQEKILLVDDTPAIIDIVKTDLEENGYEVFVATSGEKAITRAERVMPDLILLTEFCAIPEWDAWQEQRNRSICISL